MEIALQCELWGRQDTGVHAIRLPVSVIREEMDLASGGGPRGFGLVTKPGPRRNEHEPQNENDRDVVLPRASLVRPEKRFRENLPQARHISPRERHRR